MKRAKGGGCSLHLQEEWKKPNWGGGVTFLRRVGSVEEMGEAGGLSTEAKCRVNSSSSQPPHCFCCFFLAHSSPLHPPMIKGGNLPCLWSKGGRVGVGGVVGGVQHREEEGRFGGHLADELNFVTM